MSGGNNQQTKSALVIKDNGESFITVLQSSKNHLDHQTTGFIRNLSQEYRPELSCDKVEMTASGNFFNNSGSDGGLHYYPNQIGWSSEEGPRKKTLSAATEGEQLIKVVGVTDDRSAQKRPSSQAKQTFLDQYYSAARSIQTLIRQSQSTTKSQTMVASLPNHLKRNASDTIKTKS